MLLPVIYLQITTSSSASLVDLHARKKSQISSLFDPYTTIIMSSPQIKLASSMGTPPAQLTQGKDDAGSKVIITFWPAEEYRKLQRAGFPEWKGINIDEKPCSADEKAKLIRSTETLIPKAIGSNNVPGLRLKPGKTEFEFHGSCQAQWLPVHNMFDLRVERGEGGKCENDERCFGIVFVQTGNGMLEDINGRDNHGKEFHDSIESVDREAFDSHHATLRPPQT